MRTASIKDSRLGRVAVLVDQLALGVEAERLTRSQTAAACAQIDELVALLNGRSGQGAQRLARSLERLSTRLARPDTRKRPRQADAARQRRLFASLRRIALILSAGAALAAPLVVPTAAAAQTVGDPIVHPVTGATLNVTAVVPNGVIATGDVFILTNLTVGASLPDPDTAGATVTIKSLVTDPGSGRVTAVILNDDRVLQRVAAVSSQPSEPGAGALPLPAGVGDVNYFEDPRRAAGGGGGRDGALFVPATNGGDGQRGPDFHQPIDASRGDITTVTNGRPGIIVSSVGGNGGAGGDGYLGASGASGGRGGDGGNVSATAGAFNISTSGSAAHGMVVQSRAGVGGEGGSGFVFSPAGDGGAGSNGGSATATSFANITTRGQGAHGVFAQSLGAGGGGGGGSYGLFGAGGAGNAGGDGGAAEAINHGSINTFGPNSHGVTAQSIGGVGGDAGNAVGIVSFTQGARAGGAGGTATVRAGATSDVHTRGNASYGLFAQSIGGGGGSGGLNIGLVALGASGGPGGNAGEARVYAADGGQVVTEGLSSHGIFAQSIGGGGGNGGIDVGGLAMGSSGASGGTGGLVTIESGSVISTTGQDARGIFGQSVGGGGGTAIGSFGLVALGGSGAGAGGAGGVTITTSAASSITTTGQGADGVFAQSVGGGGGAGPSAGGLGALGGSAGSGGAGGDVSVTNNGSINTGGDYARGVFAQSVGGGGGAGGSSGGLVTLGGTGSAASTGGDVLLTNNGSVSTGGNMASALQAQSVGGGGGDGGNAGGVFLTIGGTGASGGAAGLVTVNNAGNLTTTGDDSHGLFAQAVGGGGGNGGSVASLSAFVGVAIGGAGDVGGAGGQVDVSLGQRTVEIGGVSQMVDAVIQTSGDRARGVFVQSVGGGGGNGGFAANLTGGYAIGASIALGGNGAAGGHGGQVDLDGDATILTSGDFSQGLLAQSVGGGGGNGGFAVSAAFSGGETISGAFALSLGGKGAGGGDGGLVTINSGGAIQTEGDFSTGFLTQSVGGGGGNGGFAVAISGTGSGGVSGAASVGLGGQGAGGGVGGTVNGVFDGTILTKGDDAGAALIQSVGGGGGNGGFSVAGAVAVAGGASGTASVGLGGSGAGGGAGGTVTGRVGGAVQTEGDRSTGVTIQSVGGGGGNGGFNVSGGFAASGGASGAVSVGLGGTGAGGGAGGNVTGSSGSTILTLGDQSGGLLVQSVGGGGGSGGFNVSGAIGGGSSFGAGLSVGLGGAGGGGGDGGTVNGSAEGFVRTEGDQSNGVTIQSVGGGGGNGGFDVSASIGASGGVGGGFSVGIGGSGGSGGSGGAVTASGVGVETLGDQSNAFLAQSIGGGGGNGGFTVAGTIGGGGAAALGVAVGVGGSGGGGGTGGSVDAELTGAVDTWGDDADGITTQSIGGGGGNGGFSVAGSIGAAGGGAGAISVGVGGSGGTGGASGAVGLDVIGTTRTRGDNSDAVVAQSVGGGGGNGGFTVAAGIAGAGGGSGTVSVGVGGSGGGGGDAGGVDLSVNAGVADAANTLIAAVTSGDGARGVLAQSVGGGGGNGSFAVAGGISGSKFASGNLGVGIGGGGGDGGDGSTVNADVNGDVGTIGDDADAILAQSVGGGGGNGSFAVTGGIAGTKVASGNMMIGVGGFGGGGGVSGDVTGVVTSDVATTGARSNGVTYQSVGGGGGNGGFAVSGAISASAGGSGTATVGVGGSGGLGGASGAVDLDYTGRVGTSGIDSLGLLAQSVGGGGGNGSFGVSGAIAASGGGAGTIGIGVGGTGGGGGSAGAVTLAVNAAVADAADTLVAAVTTGAGADAITAQSIGGGGGNGGFAVTGGISAAKGVSGNVGVGVGGGGGDGGDGSTVIADVNGDVGTTGLGASGILAQSVGGGGGNGGFSVAGGIAASKGGSGQVMVGVGGFGGGGGAGGDVSGVVSSDVTTTGEHANAITYQSLGGGGGNGGFTVAGGLTASGGVAGTASVGVGGAGGDGGSSGVVDLDVTGTTRTGSNHSLGVLAQSVGGGGGNGAFAVTGGLSASGGGAGTIGVAVGGTGGGGGNAGAVTLDVNDAVADAANTLVAALTTGDNSDAVTAQSIGGGGGSGGFSVTGGLSASKGATGNLGVGVGGGGGDGGDGAAVIADVNGDVRTTGDDSRGVIAQSVGGGGGNGGFTVAGGLAASKGAAGNLMIGVGGFGGGGGNAGDVSGVMTSDVTTEGDGAQAITYQSIGGGGGNGGFTVTGSLSASAGAGLSVGLGVGGFGGDGGDSGDVSLDLTGSTYTAGSGAGGVLAQSLGGGGGNGGFNVAGNVAISAGGAGTVGLAVGGFGGGGGNAGDVELAITGNAAPNGQIVAAVTQRENAPAIVAQSIGGGGGSGGFNVTAGVALSKAAAGNLGVGIGGGGGDGGDAGDVIADVTGYVATLGNNSGAILAQSVGGGGGNGGFNITGGLSASKAANGNLMLGVGGFGGLGGDAGDVSGTVVGDIRTLGESSYGLSYQSIGGGGGNGGFNITGGISAGVGGTGNLGIGVGGFGGAGGDAGDASLTYTGDVDTSTTNAPSPFNTAAHGLLVQSLGGGGGNGAFNVTGAVSVSKAASGVLGIGIGGFGGGGGDAGNVNAVLTGDVSTSSSRAFGALLASQGGGGGNGGVNVTGALTLSLSSGASAAIGLGLGGFGGGGGDAGNVTGAVTGDYVTRGDNAAGVIAQSLGGAGGNGGVNVTGTVGIAAGNGTGASVGVGVGGFGGAGGDAGDVVLTRTGTTLTDGLNSHGVVAQSVGGGGGNGGVNVTAGLSISSGANAASIGLGVGGFGGSGGDAGDVTATVVGSVFARGAADPVIVEAFDSPIDIPDTIVDIADFVTGGRVNLTERPEHRSITDGSHGILAQSIGGGGGNGGINVTGQLSLVKPGGSSSSRVAAIGLGGFGGDGGDAGNVNLTVRAPSADRVQAHGYGDFRSAVAAQSIGGGGGSGGINVSGGVTMDGLLVMGVGGYGGAGGLGGDVVANVNADLWATGWQASGFLAQSVGGGGGAGGMNFSGGFSADKTATEPSITFGVGGFGGAGNAAGDVIARQYGQVMVQGYQSHGVLVQSIGGGGGVGGLNLAADVHLGRASSGSKTHGVGAAIGVGGSGGDGADAGNVSLDSVGAIFVNAVASGNADDPWKAADYAADGVGVLVQSVGGGGGVGGVNISGAVAPVGQPVAVGIGGSGGSGGNAGTVSVTRGYEMVGGVETDAASVIRTFGPNGDGLVAQSIGGGGGRAGVNLVLALTVKSPSDNTAAAIIAVGGGGAGAGSADDVDVRHNGVIITDGDRSDGLIAQSIGGGGGDANFNVGLGALKNANAAKIAIGGATGAAGTGADVTVEHDGTIVTRGEDSMGVLAQSIGGGGGNAGMDMVIGILAKNSVAVTLGREGGAGGESGDVSVDVDGLIDTSGARSTAVLAQSIGGGGGNSGVRSIGASTTRNAGTPDAASYGANLAVGIDGGLGAVSGDVSVTAAGDIVTRGDDARGIHAQSIGGGGGNGGAAGNFTFRAGGEFNTAVGGDGGIGSAAGQVDVANAATIATLGDRADGILAQSIGGSGGTGGSARSIAFQVGGVPKGNTTGTISANVGGTGGEGATGDSVSVINTGVIATGGDSSFGIRAQSIGGGGGVGGAAINARIQGKNQNWSTDLNVGGTGGTGGAAGNVDVVNEGVIRTEGDRASAISANSIGGGGGDAGIVMDMVVGVTGDNRSHRAVMNLGGFGGTGGTAGNVSVINRDTGAENSGVIVTEGNLAHGIFAQSLGGGGGNGSTVLSFTGMKSAENSLTTGLTIGGMGGDGDIAGDVRVENTGVIDTSGDTSHGILAQSIGGGGGNGGLAIQGSLLVGSVTNTPMITIGGVGGDGADSGDVVVENSGLIVTRGAGAHAIVAQAIGGGGGNAQLGLSGSLNAGSMAVSTPLSFLVGGVGGGTGGLAGDVTVNHTGDIYVFGENATGILAESINGGGGSLTMDVSGIIGLPGIPFVDIHGETKTADPVFASRAGAFSSQGQGGGTVTLTTAGTIVIGGGNSLGAFNQSVGGGGGTILIDAEIAPDLGELSAGPQAIAAVGGSAAAVAPGAAAIGFGATLGGKDGVDNDGGAIASTHTGAIGTLGVNAPGALVQSIGGGGGRAVIDIDAPADALLGDVVVDLGGENGLRESGGDVARIQDGAIQTEGDLSAGAILQSIGGGGGSASVVLTGAGAADAAVQATLGAIGGSVLNGGDVSGDFAGGVFTAGDAAPGLLVQSIGGGGGETRVTGAATLDIALGGSAGASGDGGAVSLTNDGAVSTQGDGSHAVVLQSIGGGGGAVFGSADAITLTLNDDNTGDGGDIAFSQTGDIVTQGDGAHGVMAQSIGGGGGFVAGEFAGTAGGAGAGGAIDLDIDGQVFAAGADSVAIWAQSLGADGAGDVSIAVDGVVRGGSGSGAGVVIDGGATNAITASGSVSAVSGMAFRTGDGDETITSDGLVIGDLDLGGGDNRFTNQADGTFVARETIDLRDDPSASGVFVNEGDLQMGLGASRYPIDLLAGDEFSNLDHQGDPTTNLMHGARVITQVDLDGDFVQTATGNLVFDVAFGPYESDRVDVTGDATVDGTGVVTLTWLQDIERVTLFATGGQGVDNGLEIEDTLAVDYGIQADGDGVHLTVATDFGQDFLNANGQEMGRSMDSALIEGGSAGIGRLAAWLGNMRVGQEQTYAAVFRELDPQPHLAPLHMQLTNAIGFGGDIFNCRPDGSAGDQCIWGEIEQSWWDREETPDIWGVDARSMRLRAGFEQTLNGPWSAAVAVGYDQLDRMAVDETRALSDGQAISLGAGLRRADTGLADLGVSASAGWQWIDTDRTVTLFEPGVGQSKPESGYFQIAGQAAKLFQHGSLFARPSLNASVTALHGDGFEETGLDGLGVVRVSDTQVIGTVNPQLEAGFVWSQTPGVESSLSVSVGGLFHSEDRLESPFRLVGANPTSEPAVISTILDREVLTAGVGFRMVGEDGVAIHINYSGEFSDNAETHSAGFDFRWRF